MRPTPRGSHRAAGRDIHSRETELAGNLYQEMHAVFVGHTHFQSVIQALDSAFELRVEDGDPGTLPCIPVVGPSGVGKTTVFKRFKRSHPIEKDGRRQIDRSGLVSVSDRVRLLCVTMPVTVSPTKLAREMLHELGDPLYESGKAEGLDDRVDNLMRRCAVEGVLIDEGQRVLDRAGVLTAEKMIDWIKDRHARNNAVFALFGLARMRKLFEQDVQYDNRWDAELRMEPYAWGEDDAVDLSSRDNFIGLLAGLRSGSPAPWAAELTIVDEEGAVLDEDVAKRFFYASRGLMGGVKNLLKMAARILIEDRKNQTEGGTPGVIDMKLLERAFDRKVRKEKENERLINPFGVEWDGRLPPPIPEENEATALAKYKRRSGQARARRGASRSDRRREIDAALTKG